MKCYRLLVKPCETQTCGGIMSALLHHPTVLLSGEISPFVGDWAGDRPGLDVLDTRIIKPRFLGISAQYRLRYPDG